MLGQSETDHIYKHQPNGRLAPILLKLITLDQRLQFDKVKLLDECPIDQTNESSERVAYHLLPIGVATYSFIQQFQHYKTNNHESKWLF